MTDAISPLPTDVGTLQALLQAAWAERDAERAAKVEAIEQNENLRHLLARLQRGEFGRSSEKLDPDQLGLALEDIETALAKADAEAEKADPALAETNTRKRRARGLTPKDAEEIHNTLLPEDCACPHCRAEMAVIGEDVSRRIDIVPLKVRVIFTHRPILACRACKEAVVQAPAPKHIVPGGLPTEAFVAWVLASKYAMHLPLYRLAQMLGARGLAIDRSTLAQWVGFAAAEIWLIYSRLQRIILAAPKIFVDETIAPVLDPGRGKTRRDYFWSVARDDRPWGGTEPPAVFYAYTPGRGAKHGQEVLRSYGGIVQCDAYAAYQTMATKAAHTNAPIALAYCMAHFRRRFYDLAKTGAAPIAEEALRRIAQLYKIESDINGSSPDQRRDARQVKSRPICEELKTWLEHRLLEVSGKGKVAESIRYGLSHWEGLTRFLDDGRIEIDNNTAERTIRPICLGRKNHLFAGSPDGAENWAAIASLVETCKLNGVDPEAYFTDVLTKLVGGWPPEQLDDLMPWAWAKARAALN